MTSVPLASLPAVYAQANIDPTAITVQPLALGLHSVSLNETMTLRVTPQQWDEIDAAVRDGMRPGGGVTYVESTRMSEIGS